MNREESMNTNDERRPVDGDGVSPARRPDDEREELG
jgi:hypothetical protein